MFIRKKSVEIIRIEFKKFNFNIIHDELIALILSVKFWCCLISSLCKTDSKFSFMRQSMKLTYIIDCIYRLI